MADDHTLVKKKTTVVAIRKTVVDPWREKNKTKRRRNGIVII
jgi:hypothetical protein